MKKQLISLLMISMASLSSVIAQPYTADPYTLTLFHFDEAAGIGLPQDSSLYANHPTTGPLATGDTGVFGNAMAFTNNTFLSIPDSISFDKAQTNGTIELWVKPDASIVNVWGGDRTFLMKDDSGVIAGHFRLGFRMNPIANGGGVFYLLIDGVDGEQRMLRSPGLIKASQWFHVVLAWDSVAKPTLMVDGVSQMLTDSAPYKDTTYNGPLFMADSPLLVGLGHHDHAGYILLDELRITIPSPSPGTEITIR